MAIRLNYISAVSAEYMINFNGLNYTVLIGKDNKVRIQQKTNSFQVWQSIKNAVLTYHTTYFA